VREGRSAVATRQRSDRQLGDLDEKEAGTLQRTQRRGYRLKCGRAGHWGRSGRKNQRGSHAFTTVQRRPCEFICGSNLSCQVRVTDRRNSATIRRRRLVMSRAFMRWWAAIVRPGVSRTAPNSWSGPPHQQPYRQNAGKSVHASAHSPQYTTFVPFPQPNSGLTVIRRNIG